MSIITKTDKDRFEQAVIMSYTIVPKNCNPHIATYTPYYGVAFCQIRSPWWVPSNFAIFKIRKSKHSRTKYIYLNITSHELGVYFINDYSTNKGPLHIFYDEYLEKNQKTLTRITNMIRRTIIDAVSTAQ